MDSSSWEESDESDVDSNISEEEREAYEEEIKKKRYSDTTREYFFIYHVTFNSMGQGTT